MVGARDHAHACVRRLDQGGQHAAQTPRVLGVRALPALESCCCAAAVEHAGGTHTHTSEHPCDCLFKVPASCADNMRCSPRQKDVPVLRHADCRAASPSFQGYTCWLLFLARASPPAGAHTAPNAVPAAAAAHERQQTVYEMPATRAAHSVAVSMEQTKRGCTSMPCNTYKACLNTQRAMRNAHARATPHHQSTQPNANPRQPTTHVGSEHKVHHGCAAE